MGREMSLGGNGMHPGERTLPASVWENGVSDTSRRINRQTEESHAPHSHLRR